MDLSKDFLGRVAYNEDPTFSGRCKIQVKTYHGLHHNHPQYSVAEMVLAIYQYQKLEQ